MLVCKISAASSNTIVHFSFLKTLPSLYANEELEMQTILGPVIEAALMTTQVDVHNWFNKEQANKVVVDKDQNQTYETIPVGKIYLFHCTLPTYGNDTDTPGRLKPRWTNSIDEIRKLLGSDKEKTVLSPELNKYYLGLGQKCVKDFASGVELFLFPPANGKLHSVYCKPVNYIFVFLNRFIFGCCHSWRVDSTEWNWSYF